MSVLANLFAKPYTGDPRDLKNPANPATWTSGTMSSVDTTSGQRVGPVKAMGLAAYFACTRVLGEDIGKLPIKIYRRQADGTKQVVTDDPVYRLLHTQPSSEQSAFSFRETMTMRAANWGNACAEIERNGAGEPIALWPIAPDRVDLRRYEGGQLYYRVRNNGGTETHIAPENMFHLKGPGNGLWGWSVAHVGAESIGVGLASQKYAAAFFGNGARPSGILKHPGKMQQEARKHLREEWNKGYSGAPNAAKVAVLDDGAEWQSITMPPSEAQMVDTRQFSVEEVCRWFRMLPHKISHYLRTPGWSTLEAQNTSHVVDCLMPWFVRWEQEIQRKLLGVETDLFAEHLADALLRGDLKTRWEAYGKAWGIGALTINRILALENQNGIGPMGDVRFIPMNMQTLDSAVENGNSGETNNARDDMPRTPPSRSITRADVAGAMQPVFEATAGRLCRVARDRVIGLVQKYAGDPAALEAALGAFYSEREKHITKAFLPLGEVLARIPEEI